MTRYLESRTGAQWGGFMAPRPSMQWGDRCLCSHGKQLHTPTGRMDDTTIRGQGPCTAGTYGRRCECTKYEEKKR